ncbi:MAG: hypothetical protein WCG48_01790 [Candidatus Berkelbacteria bacterium]
MIKNFWQKFTIFTIMFLLVFSQYFNMPTAARAATDTEVPEEDYGNPDPRPLIDIPNQPLISPVANTTTTTCSAYLTADAANQVYKDKIYKFFEGFWLDSNPLKFSSLTDAFSSGSETKLIFNQTDLTAIRGLYCSGRSAPNFEQDMVNLYLYLPDDLRKTLPADYMTYLTNLKYGLSGETADQTLTRNKELIKLANAAQTAYAANWRENTTKGLDKIKTAIENGADLQTAISSSDFDISSLMCVTGMTQNEIINYLQTQPAQLFTKASAAIDGLMIDVRILKALVYLVTPKDQGGAGHWRIKVKKILQSNPNSTESTTIYSEINAAAKTVTPSSCDGMTAAECGQKANDSAVPSLEITEKNGDQYDAFLSSITEDTSNISAHKSGQAIDIEQIDDIRCTIIGRKRITWFGNSDSVNKQAPNPIKLAWQTTASYNASGGNPTDLAGLLKQSATTELQSYLTELGADTTGYEGDLANANIGDYGSLIGKSLLGEMLGSNSLSLPGDTIEKTLSNLGSSIFADYIGVPREVFLNQKITSLDDLKYLIGRAAIEKRLNIPYGSLDSYNYEQSQVLGMPTANLEGLLLNAGKRKLETEMNLRDGDLDGYIGNGINQTSKNTAVYTGQRVIEGALNINKGSFVVQGKDGALKFGDLKKYIGTLKLTALELNPAYMDNVFHVDANTTKNFVDGKTTAVQFAGEIGQKRLDDTIYGFKYLAASDAAYQLPENTWENAITGDKTSVINIGVSMIAKVFATSVDNPDFKLYANDSRYTVSPSALGTAATTAWLKDNLTKSDEASCKPSGEIPEKDVPFTVTEKSSGKVIFNKTIPIKINFANFLQNGLTKSDVSRIFNCASANGRAVYEKVGEKLLYYGILAKTDGQVQGNTTSLLDVNSIRKIEDNNFYLSRKNQIERNVETIKSAYEQIKTDDINWVEFNNSINRINATFDSLAVESSFSIDSIESMAQAIIGISNEFDKIKVILATITNKYEGERSDKIGRLNQMIAIANETFRLCEEIIVGHDVVTTGTITINQIDPAALTIQQTDGSATTTSQKRAVTPTTVLNFLAGKLSITDFILLLGTSQAEARLGLPQNTFIYFIHNAEDKGISNKDAFFQAVGQAKIEQSLGMQLFSFQGTSLNDGMPAFRYDLDQLSRWVGDEIYQDKEDFLYNNGYYLPDGSKTVPRYSSDLTIEYLTVLRTNKDALFDQYVSVAKTKWQSAKDLQLKSQGGTSMKEYTLNDIVDNMSSRNLINSTAGAKSEIVNRFGLSANYDSLISGAPGSWAVANPAANKIDDLFNIPRGSTQMLFTGKISDKVTLSDQDLQYLEAKMKLPKNGVNLFVQLLNGDVTLDQITNKGLTPDYVVTNPYFDANLDSGPTCPVQYRVTEVDKPLGQGNFIVSDSSLNADDYCYYDTAGRHCFKSYAESTRYIDEHKEAAYTDIIGLMSTAFGVDKNELVRYIQKQSDTVTVNTTTVTDQYLTDKDNGLLKRLFSRDQLKAPVQYYKRIVGEAETKRVVGNGLLSAVGIDTDQYDLDGSDLFDILRGDMTSITRLAMSKIDESAGLPKGSTKLLLTANSDNMQNCTLSSITSNYLGSVLGLSKIDLSGNVYTNIGKQRIEDVWKVSGDAFAGTSFDQVVTKVGPLDFALKTKVPLANGNGSLDNITMITDNEISSIFGGANLNYYKGQPNAMIIDQIVNKIKFLPRISADANLAIKSIEAKAQQRIKNTIATISMVAPNTYKVGANGLDQNPELKGEMSSFINNMKYLNDSLSLSSDTIYDLFTGTNSMTPDKFVDQVALATTSRLAINELAKVFGYTPQDGTDAYAAISGIKDTFICSRFSLNHSTCTDSKYHNWVTLYSNLNKVFALNLDTKLNLEPGTVGRLLANYKNPGPIIYEVGAKKIDESLNLDSTSNASMSEIFRRFGASDDVTAANTDKACLTSSYGTDNGSSLTKIQIDAANKTYAACKASTRSDTGKAIELAKDAATTIVGDKIRAKSGINMPNFDIRQIFNGNLQNLQAAGMAYGANVVYTALDSVGARNCRSTDNGQCELPVPDSMRVSYDDIKLSFYGNQASDTAAGNAAAWAITNGSPTAANPDHSSYNYGDVCPAGGSIINGAITCLTTEGFVNNTANVSRDGISLVGANVSATYAQYGTPGAGFTAAGLLSTIDAQINDLTSQDANGNKAKIEALRSKKVAIGTAADKAQEESRKRYQDALKYRMLDAMFWKLDDNIFPGFSNALFNGSAKDKSLALATYLKNGLISGHLFGAEFNGIKNAQDLAAYTSIYRFTKDWNMDNFVADKDGGFDYLSNLISKNSDKWLGFEINNEMAQGLLVGISEGYSKQDWSFGFDKQNTTYTIGGRTMNTLGTSVTNWATGKLFNWLDNRLGWGQGTALKTYELAKTAYDANKAYQAAQKTGDAAQIAQTAQALATAVIAVIDFAVQSIYQNNWADDIANLEQQWNLTPGTLNMIVSSAITVGVAYGVTLIATGAVGAAASTALAVASAAFWPVLVIALLLNLFSVYRTDVICSADNYYPNEETPDSAKYDVGNLGTWNGADPVVSQQKSIEAAQYKASRLIGDLLLMPDSSMFRDGNIDIAPIQIMTGRQEDVETWSNTVTTNMCQKRLGKNSISVEGVCGSCSVLGNCKGDTKMGLWANPQTIAWTHLGY